MRSGDTSLASPERRVDSMQAVPYLSHRAQGERRNESVSDVFHRSKSLFSPNDRHCKVVAGAGEM